MKRAVLLRRWPVLMYFFFIQLTCISQTVPPGNDSLKMYRSIETYARKKGFTYTLYKAIFKPVSELNQKESKRLKRPSFDEQEGKVIRAIYIRPSDPFGYNIRDTSATYSNFLTRTGNALHIRTSSAAIRNQLLFQEGDTVDALRMMESERLLRAQPYVRDVFIYTEAAGPDSVDVYVREVDVWTILVKLSGQHGETKILLSESNFAGTGHRFDNSVRFIPRRKNIYEGIYSVPNFRNTYVSGTLFYYADFDSVFYSGVRINRGFYSPLTKWAGGIAFSYTTTSDTLFYGKDLQTIPDVKYRGYEVWGGKSWQLFRRISSFSRITNLILATRYQYTDFLSNPLGDADTLGLLTDETFYLASIGLSQRLYIKDSYIFRFGLAEDVPTGQLLSFTVGRQFKGSLHRTYVGGRLGWGNYTGGAGYLAFNIEYGGFRNKSRMEEGVFSMDLTYFTKLSELGRWKFRQFLKPRLTLGFRQLPTRVITINEDDGIQGFDSPGLYGLQRFVIASQTQLYAPYSLIGFRFAPVFYFTGALLSGNNKSLLRSRFYTSAGFGILFRNELLIFNTFQVAIAFYPVIPGLASNLLKLNSIKSYDFRFRDFEVEKPAPVTFQ